MGREAQIAGKNKEQWIEVSLLQYRLDGLAFGQRNWPEIKQWGSKAVVVGPAGPDWTVFVAPLGGQAVQLEVKTWQAKDSHFYTFTGTRAKTRRRAQWQTLLDAVKVGGCLGFYLTAWRHPSFEVDWRLHEATSVPFDGRGLTFSRRDGLAVEETEAGWPDWLPIVLKYDE